MTDTDFAERYTEEVQALAHLMHRILLDLETRGWDNMAIQGEMLSETCLKHYGIEQAVLDAALRDLAEGVDDRPATH